MVLLHPVASMRILDYHLKWPTNRRVLQKYFQPQVCVKTYGKWFDNTGVVSNVQQRFN